MKLDTEFYKLPLRFDPARLAEEVLQFTEEEWRAHPQSHEGNSALPLVSVGGGINDHVRGAMLGTPFLERCPYIRQILASLGTVIGRARLMRIAGASDAHAHVDTNYYWMHHVRVHIPALTYPEVQFLCEDKAVHMAAGETWIFDSWKLHNVLNPDNRPRIHLVADTVGSAHFWALVDKAERPVDPSANTPATATMIPFEPSRTVDIPFESRNFPVVMTPWEQEALAARMFAGLAPEGDSTLRELTALLHREWFSLWTQYGDHAAGWPAFQKTLQAYDADLAPWAGKLLLPNGVDLVEALRQAIVRPALTPELAAPAEPAPKRIPAPPEPSAPAPIAPPPSNFDRPVFIVSAPRSGSTMLFELLSRAPDFFTIGGESHGIIEGIANLNPAQRNFDSNRLVAADADLPTIAQLRHRFFSRLKNAAGQPPVADTPFRMLEKTPKNALRIPFLRAAFPDARFIYLHRDPRENISSILDAWRSGRFVTYPRLRGWSGQPWSLTLIPGWRELNERPLGEVAARQWTTVNEQILKDLAALPAADWTAISYDEILRNPGAAAERLCAFAGVAWEDAITGPLPLSRYTLTPPDREKWKRNAEELAPFLELAEPTAAKIRTLMEPPAPSPVTVEKAAHEPVELTSVHTSNFPELLASLGLSLLVTTYQAGRLIVLREQGGALNTHFRSFHSPMGLAYDGVHLALGTGREVWQFFNQTDVARKLEPAGTHDAVFLPRTRHFTGDIRIHEMGYVGEELWAVNTRFSCLCTFDGEHSFVPRWRPPFITALAPEDRCHLNGMAVVKGKVQFATCLGLTDTAGGWRENKASGGCLLRVPSGEIVARGLSMPHSPRMYGGHLWVLESGEGTLSTIDQETGEIRIIARMPGFTRGLDFFGPYAFIGLSQVRESAIFANLPLTERLPAEERACGIWVIDLRTGETTAFLRFEQGVQEIFAVQILPGIRQPDVITDDVEILNSSFVLPEEALRDVPAPLKGEAAPAQQSVSTTPAEPALA